MPIAFPTYAKISSESFSVERATALNRTEMSDGMIKQLRMKSRVMVTRSVVILLDSKADYASFITFFETTLNFGEFWFNWIDPVDLVSKLGRFVSKLDREEMRGGMPTKWQISAKIETWSDGL